MDGDPGNCSRPAACAGTRRRLAGVGRTLGRGSPGARRRTRFALPHCSKIAAAVWRPGWRQGPLRSGRAPHWLRFRAPAGWISRRKRCRIGRDAAEGRWGDSRQNRHHPFRLFRSTGDDQSVGRAADAGRIVQRFRSRSCNRHVPGRPGFSDGWVHHPPGSLLWGCGLEANVRDALARGSVSRRTQPGSPGSLGPHRRGPLTAGPTVSQRTSDWGPRRIRSSCECRFAARGDREHSISHLPA